MPYKNKSKREKELRAIWRKNGMCTACSAYPLIPGKSTCVRCRDLHFQRNKDLKAAAIKAYGGQCNCCGETQSQFLTIDCIAGNHKDHKVGYGSTLYRWLRDKQYPPEFQLLCIDCNFAK